MKVEVAVLDYLSLIWPLWTYSNELELKPTELRGCVKIEVSLLDVLSLMVLMVSVDVKQLGG